MLNSLLAKIAMTEENWDTHVDYLKRSRILYLNDDYFEFLVSKVWKLNEPCSIIDFGCGLGYLGTKLLPLLPEGSSYTGIDKSAVLLREAESMYSTSPRQYQFFQAEACSVPFEASSFDVAVSHAVLMHLERATDALNEMVRVTRDGGMVITCDANRNAHSALFYTDGINIQERIPLRLGQQMNKAIRERSGIDYNIGIRTPALMDKAGLKNIGCRISDHITCLFPSMEVKERSQLHELLCKEGLALPEDFEAKKQEWIDRLTGYGVSREDIDSQMAIELEMDFRHRGQDYFTAFPGLLTWSYGTVVKVP